MTLTEFVTNNPGATAQIALSLALVAITIIYTYYTARQTDEMSETREINNQPVVRGGIGHIGSDGLTAVVRNTGNAAAHNISTELYFPDTDTENMNLRIATLLPSEYREFGFPLKQSDEPGFITGLDEIDTRLAEADSDGVMHVKTTYENPFGKPYCYNDKIDVLDTKENLSQLRYDDEQTKMRKAVESIKSELKSVRNDINQKYTDALSRSQLYDRVLRTGREMSPVEYETLRTSIDIERGMFHRIIVSLVESGLVEYPDDQRLRIDDGVELTFPDTS